jgi:hypothetical protein
MFRKFWVCFLALASQAAAQEEKFYPVISADGRVQVITAPADKEKVAKVKKARQEKAIAEPVAGSLPPDARKVAPSSRAGAAYDSDQYVDSELLDNQEPGKLEKKRFYIIPDELGTQVNQDGMAFTPTDESSPVFDDPPVEERFRSIDENPEVLAGDLAVSAFPGLPQCLGKDDFLTVKDMLVGEPESLLIDKGIYGFLKSPGIVALYRLPGEGLRTVVASSYSRTDRKPGFVHPYLAFFDGQGCLTRVISNFYESLYPENQRRHPMLRANLAVHSEESYMVVLVPKETQTKSVASLPYQYSRFGQLKFTVKKQ